MTRPSVRPRVFTWHIHGTYLYYLCHADADFFIPVRHDHVEGYSGRAGSMPWPENLHEIPAEHVRDEDFDVILFQSRRNYEEDAYEILGPAQRHMPRIYLEHDPPREHPTDTRHIVVDPDVLLVHVTHFNRLMWDSGRVTTKVIEHGVVVPEDARYRGNLERGIVVVNNLISRGRRLGLDVFEEVARDVPLDLAGMGSKELGGLGDLSRDHLFAAETERRFFFNPIRYSSLGLSVLEAMMLSMPIVGLATTEMPVVIESGVSGYIDTDVDRLVAAMQGLLSDRAEAERLGNNARETAKDRFNIDRFAGDWNETFALVLGRKAPVAVAR
jgi:glycosyltransferase involved in cell wall biosynthesis